MRGDHGSCGRGLRVEKGHQGVRYGRKVSMDIILWHWAITITSSPDRA